MSGLGDDELFWFDIDEKDKDEMKNKINTLGLL